MLQYLQGYPIPLVEKVQTLIDQGELSHWLGKKYPTKHEIQTDKALYEFVIRIKQQHLKNCNTLSVIKYDSKQHPIKGTLGTNTFVSRVQGNKLKSKNEIRVASLFKEAPQEFLTMIVVHELAHLKVKDHNKAFYQLCCHIEPDYHQFEFDMRVWLTWRELNKQSEQV